MNTKVVSAIAFKLFAIYVVVAGVIALPSIMGIFISMRRTPMDSHVSILWPIIIAITTIIIAIIIGKLFWKLGNSTISDISELNSSGADNDVQSMEKMFFTLLGVYFTVAALVDLPNLAASFWAKSHVPDATTIVDYAWLISVIIQLVIGLSLIKKLDKWLLFVRSIGVK